MNQNYFAVLALAAAAPFVTGLEPGTDTPAPTAAPQTTPAEAPAAAETPAPAPSPTSAPAAAAPAPVPAVSPLALDPRVAGAALKQPAVNALPAGAPLSNLVADAIKRKLERVAAGKANGGIEPAGVSTVDSPSTPKDTASPFNPQVGLVGGSPEARMMSGGARVMMGSPTDGSPSYVRVAASPAGESGAAGGNISRANPLANSTDPMENAGGATVAAAAEPGPNHNMLDIFVGTWDVSANFDTGPGQPPETASGQMSNTWQLDGRWLKQEYSGQMASLGSFRGLGFLGYDNLQKTFVGTWMDTLSTSCFVSKGAFDDARATFTLSGDFTVEGGEKYKQKQVMTVLTPDRYIVTMYLTGPDGAEFKTGNLEYTRSAKKVTIAPAK